MEIKEEGARCHTVTRGGQLTSVVTPCRVHPLGGLPPEIWEKVLLEHLCNDPASLFTCYRTCTTWKGILEPEKTKFLFLFVAPLLKTKYLSTEEFIKCRQICNNWRYAVDKTFENVSQLRRDPSVHSGVPPYTWYGDTVGVVLKSASHIQNFITEVASNPNGHPFFLKTIKCAGRFRNNGQESNRLFQDFARLISEHGPSIQACVYLAYGGQPECERQMERLFDSLPNLKSLAILKSGDANNNTGLDWLINRKDLLPRLPHLTSINIYLDDAALIAEMLLLSYGTQIESFHCDFSVISSCGFFRGPAPQGSLKMLRDLDVFDAFGNSVFLERLLLYEMPFLARIALEYVEVGPRRRSFKSLLRIIDKFSESLKEIRLPQKLFNWESERSSEIVEFKKYTQVALPNVTELGVNIQVLECPVKDWFFTKFPSLKTLRVTNYGVIYYVREDIQRKKLEEEVAPFWKLAPTVQNIIVERAYLGEIHFHLSKEN